MAYILSHDLGLDATTPEGLEFQQRKWTEYAQYLESIRDRLPRSAFEFATGNWRRSEDHYSLHDSWVECLTISESSSGNRREDRSLEIQVRLLGAYHDGYTTLKYHQVQSYSLSTPREPSLPSFDVGHGDWLHDEIRLSDRGFVLHEVEFSRGSRWTIECKDIERTWEPKRNSLGVSPAPL